MGRMHEWGYCECEDVFDLSTLKWKGRLLGVRFITNPSKVPCVCQVCGDGVGATGVESGTPSKT